MWKAWEDFSKLPAGEVFIYIAKPLLILAIGKVLVTVILKILNNFFERAKLDDGIRGFLKQVIKIAVYIVALIMAAQSLGADTASLVTMLGVVSLAFSLSLQNILTNIFSGIVILVTKPFVVGDFVEICGVIGKVTAITLMRTKINTPDNKVELLPNSDVATGRISNYSNEALRRVDFEVFASYDDPTDKVIDAIRSVIDKDERIIKDEEYAPTVRLSKFGNNDITYSAKVWCPNEFYWDVYYDTLKEIREVYIERGITFSYPHTVVHFSDESKAK